MGTAWMDQAACVGVDPAIMFPSRGEAETLAVAMSYCARCPVRAECLEYALTFPDYCNGGVWGGTSARERRKMRKGRAA